MKLILVDTGQSADLNLSRQKMRRRMTTTNEAQLATTKCNGGEV
jgi:hypothetical protein